MNKIAVSILCCFFGTHLSSQNIGKTERFYSCQNEFVKIVIDRSDDGLFADLYILNIGNKTLVTDTSCLVDYNEYRGSYQFKTDSELFITNEIEYISDCHHDSGKCVIKSNEFIHKKFNLYSLKYINLFIIIWSLDFPNKVFNQEENKVELNYSEKLILNCNEFKK